MGGSIASQVKVAHTLDKSEEEIVRLMMPIFYNPTRIDAEERKKAQESWNLILNDKSPVFLTRREQEKNFPFPTCVTFFYDTFYTRLFDIHPICRPLFKNGMRSQGRFLVRMITLSLSEIDDSGSFEQNLQKLAEIHYQRGVKTVEYGIVGEVLFHTLRVCLGPTIYYQFLHRIWVKIYSRMLSTIVPIAVSLELKSIRNPTSPAVPARIQRSVISTCYYNTNHSNHSHEEYYGEGQTDFISQQSCSNSQSQKHTQVIMHMFSESQTQSFSEPVSINVTMSISAETLVEQHSHINNNSNNNNNNNQQGNNLPVNHRKSIVISEHEEHTLHLRWNCS